MQPDNFLIFNYSEPMRWWQFIPQSPAGATTFCRYQNHDQELAITTLIQEAVIKARKEHPSINGSAGGYKIVRKYHIDLGIRSARPGGNLIVPVIRQADKLQNFDLNGTMQHCRKMGLFLS